MPTKPKKRKRNPGKPAHRPTPQLRRQVETMVGIGIRYLDIIQVIGIGSTNTLEKYYRAELDAGLAKTRATMSRRFYQHAVEGADWKATREWLRLFGGDQWKDAARIEVTGKDGGPLEVMPVPVTAERIAEVLATLRDVLPEGAGVDDADS